MMVDGVTVDANIIIQFRDEWAAGHGGLLDLINALLEKRGLVLDQGGIMRHEWTAGDSCAVVEQWIAQEQIAGRIRLVKGHLDQHVRRLLITQFGLPQASRDHHYIRVANDTKCKYIVSEDIDLYDPRQKCAPHATKEGTKLQRSGALCRFLKKKLNIVVGLPCHCAGDLCL